MKINFPIINFYKSFYISKTNSQVLKPIPFDTFEKTTFSGRRKSRPSNDFTIRGIKNIRCPACGSITLTNNDIEQFVSEIANKKGRDLVRTLEKYEDDSIITHISQNPPKSIFRPQKQQIVNAIKKLAAEFPNKNLPQLIAIERDRRIDALIQEQLPVMDEIIKYIKNSKMTDEEKQAALLKIDSYIKEINGEKGAERFGRRKFIYAVSSEAMPGSPLIRKELEKIAIKLPSSEDNIDSWFVKFSGKPSAEIASSLVREYIPTAEHIEPHSKGGANKIRNFLCYCAYCNSRRSNTNFADWMLTVPEPDKFQERLQNYLQEVQDSLDSDLGFMRPHRKEHIDYVDDIINVIREQSNGKIILHGPIIRDREVLAIRMKRIKLSETSIKKQEKAKNKIALRVNKLKAHPYYTYTVKMPERLLQIQKQMETATEPRRIELQKRVDIIERALQKHQIEIEDMENCDIKIAALNRDINNIIVLSEYLKKYQNPSTKTSKMIIERLKKILQGRTIEQMKAELAQLEQLRKDIIDIKNIEELEAKIANAEKVIMHNQDVLTYILRNYRTLTNKQFQQQLANIKKCF